MILFIHQKLIYSWQFAHIKPIKIVLGANFRLNARNKLESSIKGRRGPNFVIHYDNRSVWMFVKREINLISSIYDANMFFLVLLIQDFLKTQIGWLPSPRTKKIKLCISNDLFAFSSEYCLIYHGSHIFKLNEIVLLGNNA